MQSTIAVPAPTTQAVRTTPLRRLAGAALIAAPLLMAGGMLTSPPQADDSSFLSQVEGGSSGGQGCSILLTFWQSPEGRPGGGWFHRISPGDRVEVELPAEPFVPLAPV